MKKLFPLIQFLFLAITAYSQTTLDFHNLTDMPTARGTITSATDGKYFYVCNGFSFTEKYTGLIEKYDVAKDEWSVLTTSIIPKQFPSSAIIGNELYIFNGDLKDKSLNKKLEVVNTKNGKIKFSADNPMPAHAGGVAVWDGMIYAFGGKISSDQQKYSNNLFRFDPDKKKWTKLASMPEEKEAKGVIVDGKLYVIGGYNGKASDQIDVYDIKTDKWTKIANLPNGISANSVVAYESKIYTLFDFTNQTFIGCYDIPSNTFAIVKQINMIGRRHAGAHVVHDKLYIMGGNTSIAINSCLSSLQVAELNK